MKGNMQLYLEIEPPVGMSSSPSDKLPEGDIELRNDFMIGREGICYDYFNQILSIEMYCQMLSGETQLGLKQEEIRRELLENIRRCISYSEYFNKVSKKPEAALAFKKFLTEKGKEDWKRLDEIVAEMKLIAQYDFEQASLEKLKSLLEEAKSLLPD